MSATRITSDASAFSTLMTKPTAKPATRTASRAVCSESAAPVTFGAMHLGEVLARYMEQFPHVNVEVALSDRYVDLLESGVDVAVRIGRLRDSALIARRLAPCRMVICASPDYIARNGMPRSPDDLRQAP